MLRGRKSRDDDSVIEDLHEAVFRETDCTNCANCCKTHSPILLHSDIQRISKNLKIRPHTFKSEYLLLDEDNDWVFQITPCPFLAPDNKCIIYDVRPKACKEYPHTNRKKLYEIEDITIKNAEICPAVSKILDAAMDKISFK